jgi:hypothetical protein
MPSAWQNGGMSKCKSKRAPKAVLRLPDLEQSKSAVLNSLASQSSQRSYDHAIREFIEWYCSEPRLAFNKTVVTRYRILLEQAHYASSTINLRLAAVRRLAYEAADAGLLSPDLAAGIRRVKGAKKFGVRMGNWLTAEQGRRVLGVFDRNTLRGIRDYARARQCADDGALFGMQADGSSATLDCGCTPNLDDGGENHRWADLAARRRRELSSSRLGLALATRR